MTILFINNDGGGFADEMEVPSGTTIEELFLKQMGKEDTADFLIRVNRSPVTAQYVLQNGDRVTITPTKVEGFIQIPVYVRIWPS